MERASRSEGEANAAANIVVQSRVPDALRGRIMGIYSFCFLGLTPFGSLLAGWVAKATSARFMVIAGAAVCLVASWITFARMTAQTTD